ncbi:CHAT domain-containing protein [Belliella sp. R4-6]|uniref:CHAT domain-containing protein n=1 Tax=Belliella alkalica TaxID=1730871 RepID=A0ABS9V7Q9_9BACT|nr:CHAT domain-containing protein [Belliella alkalica]MCH7412458.1 CHAT domain-containing protein [Belliella alkalica]
MIYKSTTIVISVLLFILNTHSFAQNSSKNSDVYFSNKAKLDTIKAHTKSKYGSEISNRNALVKLENFFDKNQNFDEKLECLSLLSSSYYLENNSDSALYYLKKGIVEVIRPKKTTNKDIINIFYNRYAAFLNDAGQYISSKEIYEEQLDYLRKNDTLGLARAYNNFAVLLNNLKENEQSLRYYDSCLTVLKRSGLDTASQLAKNAYLNQAMPKMNMGQFQEALESLRKSEINLVNMNMQDQPGEVIITSLYYAYVYTYKNEFPEDLENASKYAKRGYEMLYKINKDHFYMIYFYLILGDIEEKKGNLSQSLNFYKQAVALKTMLHGDVNDDMPSMLTILARLSSNIGQKDSASNYFNQIDKLYKRTNQLKTYDYIEYLFEDAEFQLKLKEIKLAENKLLQALKSYIPSYSWKNGIVDNPPLDLIPDSYQSAFFFIKKGEITKKIAELTDDTSLLNSSLDAYVIGILLLNKSKNAIFNIRSKSQYGQQKSIYFAEAIQLATALYRKTNDKIYWEKAYLLSDLNKSSNLKHHLNQKSNASQSLIPSELQAKELELKTEINLLEQQIYRDSFTKAIQSDSNDSTLQLIVKKKEEMNQLLASYKTNYPNYYSLQYGGQNFTNESIFDTKQTKSLRESKKLVVQYIEFEANFLLIYLKGKKEGLLKIDKDENLTYNLNKFINDSKNPNSKNFQASAYYLYQKLIEPVLKVEPSKHIIIIPDGVLNHINFEILIENPIAETNAFEKFNYLLKNHTITYQYASSLINFERVSLKKKEMDFLGFAPYQELGKPLFIAQTERSNNFDLTSYTALPFSEKEVASLSKKFSGKGYYGNEAKESYLKNEGKNSKILHFATHSHIDNNNPLFSSLLLSADDKEDGILYTHELYEMDLNADLVTLSACNSGFGEHQQGEGVISLARGFMYANVPNVLMSLWAVSDQSTSKLMTSFYDKVYDGESYSEAIRNAKLDYLQQADENTAHPYYWAGFVYLGDVESDKPNYFFYFFLGIATLVAIYFLTRRFRVGHVAKMR